MTKPFEDSLDQAYQTARRTLIAQRAEENHWTGELSTSALSTATAVGALALVRGADAEMAFEPLIHGGLKWLAQNQNPDGGWGDTTQSLSNISTTMLARAAFELAGQTNAYSQAVNPAVAYIHRAGGTEALRARYGKDRTFAVPILTMSALAGFVPWDEVAPLPFELACLPQSWFHRLSLPVVSYALPALIAVGQVRHAKRPPRNPLSRVIRRVAREPSLRVLDRIQPANGGFLEAVPLTSFVTMSLAGMGRRDHPVTRRGVEFIIHSVRPDGSWPIDSNLSVWLTTLSTGALAAAGPLTQSPEEPDWNAVRRWLLAQQYLTLHPYTNAAPGGWGWTHLPGGVPDADDTAGALLALSYLPDGEASRQAVRNGIGWLLDLQNRDGGWPTFCRGWGHLPFDRSGSDLTAHVLRAFRAWERGMSKTSGKLGGGDTRSDLGRLSERIDRARRAGLRYLARRQRSDGSWVPLWFGNQFAPDDENPTYGTARVLAAYRDLELLSSQAAQGGLAWLRATQNPDGGWGGNRGVTSSVEETALATEALLADSDKPETAAAVRKGIHWLIESVEAGGLDMPTPIGFYFAKLWYFEKLYPSISTVAALGRARKSRFASTERLSGSELRVEV